jgi:hypothetical protein
MERVSIVTAAGSLLSVFLRVGPMIYQLTKDGHNAPNLASQISEIEKTSRQHLNYSTDSQKTVQIRMSIGDRQWTGCWWHAAQHLKIWRW